MVGDIRLTPVRYSSQLYNTVTVGHTELHDRQDPQDSLLCGAKATHSGKCVIAVCALTGQLMTEWSCRDVDTAFSLLRLHVRLQYPHAESCARPLLVNALSSPNCATAITEGISMQTVIELFRLFIQDPYRSRVSILQMKAIMHDLKSFAWSCWVRVKVFLETGKQQPGLQRFSV